MTAKPSASAVASASGTGSSRLVILVMYGLLAFGASAWARQDPTLTEVPPLEPEVVTTWFTLPVRVGILAALLIVAWAFGFYAFFPWILDRKRAMRPLAAYGLSAGLIWLTWCGSALVVFQDMLVLKSPRVENTFVQDWLLTCLICLAGLIGFVMLRMIFGGRSPAADS